jgi:hypothetical protein
LRFGKIAEPVARHHQLRHDLLGGEIAHQTLRAGVAEGAGQRAADLARDAERAAIDLGDVDAFDLGAAITRAGRGHPDQPFAGAVGRNLLGCDLWQVERECSG